MTIPKHYVVHDEGKNYSGGAYLELDGPFAYPKWGASQKATVLSFAWAHAFRDAYGTKAAKVVRATEAAMENAQQMGWGLSG